MMAHDSATIAMIRGRQRLRREQAAFAQARRADIQFARQLRKIARHIGDIIDAHTNPLEDPTQVTKIQSQMEKYAQLIHPWAIAQSSRMLAEVDRRDQKAWAKVGETMSRSLREEIRNAPTGAVLRGLLAEQVGLITSLPLEAGQRVHRLTLEGLSDSTRAAEVSKEIQRSGKVAKGRANLIARTEVARTASSLTQARALHVGSDSYIWRTSEDSDVRNKDGNPVGSHRLLNGKVIRWDSPPVASTNGERAHAGSIFNCRCFAEPIIPDHFD